MKTTTKLERPKGQSASGGGRYKRIRHGLYSKRVKLYRKLDREFRDCDQPNGVMVRELCAALENAICQVLPALDPNDPAFNDYLNQFVTECMNSLERIREVVVRYLRMEKVED